MNNDAARMVDDFIFGYGQSGTEYVVRTTAPRFIAKINDPGAGVNPLDHDEKLLVTVKSDGETVDEIFYITNAKHVVSDFVWQDTPDNLEQIAGILAAMETELEIVELDDKEGHYLETVGDYEC
tara:strand:- start:786 stop:1157 length:372 start_codon:yes stop_codon:yes gene_type:complete